MALSDDATNIIHAYKDAAIKLLRFQMNVLVSNSEQTIVLWARQVRGNVEQNKLHGAARELRVKLGSVEEHFLSGMQARLEALAQPAQANAELQAQNQAHRERVIDDQVSSGEFALVDSGALEDELAILNLASGIEGKFRYAVLEINNRLAHVLERNKFDFDDNPLSPKSLVMALIQASNRAEVSGDTKPVLGRLFNRYVLDELELLYDQAVRVLPVVEDDTPVADAPAIDLTPADRPSSVHPSKPTEAQSAANEESDWRRSRTPLIAPAGKAPAMPRAQLDAILLDLQQRWLDRTRHLPAFATQRSITPLPVIELVNDVMTEYGYQTAQALPFEDVETINLVGVLFEHLLNDNGIARPVRRLIRMLQLPVIRAAMKQPEVLNSSAHPARRLIQCVIDLGADVTEPTDSVLADLQSAVLSVLRDFKDDPDCIAAVLKRIESAQPARTPFGATTGEISAAAAPVDLSVVPKDPVEQFLSDAIGAAPLSAVARQFTGGLWLKALRAIHKKYGPESKQWAQVAQLTRGMVSVAAAGATPPTSQAVAAGVSKVLQALGLTAEKADQQVQIVMADLVSSGQNGVGGSGATDSVSTPNTVASGIATGAPKPPPPPDQDRTPDPEIINTLEKMAPDSWIEVNEPGQSAFRAKLITRIPKTGLYMFTVLDTGKGLEYKRDALAFAVEDKRVRLLSASGAMTGRRRW